jgi:hypothetical protein
MVLFLINKQELFEMAGIASTQHVLAHSVKGPWLLLISFTCCYNYSLQILFCFHRGLINEILRWPQGKKSSEPSQVIAIARRSPPPSPTNPAITKSWVEMDSSNMRKMRGDTIALEPQSPVAYFCGRNTDADFRMKETLPTTCFVSQISLFWPIWNP